MEKTKKEIIDNYESFDEDSRLRSPFGILEEAHSKNMISRYLKQPSMAIYDIGAGTGPYSVWLAGLGHRVHFSDIVPKHVQLLKKRYAGAAGVTSISEEDARKLSYDDGVADLIILNGPLYHLVEREDRLKVLNECRRILTPGGTLLSFTISRFAGLHYAVGSGEIFTNDYYDMVKGELATGIRENSLRKNKTFIRAYFHLLSEIESEYTDAGLTVEKSFGVAGPATNMPGLEQVVNDPEKKKRLVEVAEMMESYPMQSPKMLTVGCKV